MASDRFQVGALDHETVIENCLLSDAQQQAP
jgi:hypothetical protein